MTRTASRTATRSLQTRRTLALSTALGASLAAFASPAAAQAIPDIINGATGATITSAGGATTPVNVNVTDARAVVNWTTFNVPDGNVANFTNSSTAATAVVLNRVTLVDSLNTSNLGGIIRGVNSAIDTTLPNQGFGVEVWVSNPNGILMGATGNFNTQGFVATTRQFDATDVGNFLAGAGALTLTAPTSLTPNRGITGEIGQIVTNGRVAAFIAPVIQLAGGSIDAGGGTVGFVAAADVTIADPGSPLGLTINAGTALNASSGTALTVGADVTGATVIYALSAQTGTDALLSLPTGATIASAAGGLIVLGGRDGGTVTQSIAAGADVGGTVSITSVAAVTGDTGAVRLLGNAGITVGGSIGTTGSAAVTIDSSGAAGTTVGITGPITTLGTGAASIAVSGRTTTVDGALSAGGTGGIAIAGAAGATVSGPVSTLGGGIAVTSTGGTAAVSGGISSGADYSVTGTAVQLGNTGLPVGTGAVTQRAAGVVTLDATAGVVGIDGGLVVTGDTDDSGDAMRIGGAGTTGLSLTASTLRSGNGGGSNIAFTTALNTDAFALGNVVAGVVSGRIGGGAPGTISRAGDIGIASLALTGANTIATTAALGVTGAVATGGALTLTGGTGVIIGGAITNLGTGTGDVTINGGGAVVPSVSITTADLTGNLLIDAGTGGARFGALSGAGAKMIVSDGAIESTVAAGGIAIGGTGAVSLTPAAAGAVSIAGSIGSAATTVASLTIAQGGAVALGPLFVTGATAIGGTFDVGSLVISGATATGSFASDSSGLTTTGAVAAATGDIAIVTSSAAGDVSTGALSTSSAGGSAIDIRSLGGVSATTLDASGAVNIDAAGVVAIDGGSTGNGGAFVVTAMGDAAVRGSVQAAGDYRVSGANVTLGTIAVPVTQAAGGQIGIAATGGGITGNSGLTLRSTGGAVGVPAILIGGAQTGAIAMAGTTIDASTSASGEIRFGTAVDTTGFVLGDVLARILSQNVGGTTTAGIGRASAVTIEDLTLTGVNSISSGSQLTVASASVTNAVTLNGDAGVGIGALVGAGDKTVTSGGSILSTVAAGGQAIAGAGAVTLTPAATGALTMPGAIGTAAVPVASLTVGQGGIVQLGPVFVAGIASFGAVNPLGSLSIASLGADSLFASSAGTLTLGAVQTPGAITLRAPTLNVASLATTGPGGTITLASDALTVTGATSTAGAVDIVADRLSAVSTTSSASFGTMSGGRDILIGQVSPFATLTIGGAVTSAGAFTSTTTAGTTVAGIAGDGAIGITSGAVTTGNSLGFGALSGAGSKTLVADGSIGGTSVTGAGAVSITPSAAGDVTIGSVGAAGAAVSALSIARGGAVVLGPLFVAGATSLGQTAALGSLTINGTATTGSFISTTSGLTDLDAIAAAGSATITAGGAADIGGNVTVGDAYSVTGSSVVLGGAGVTQRAGTSVTIAADGGTVTGNAGLTLISGTGDITLGGATTTGLQFAGTTLGAGGLSDTAGVRNIVLRTDTAARPLALGTVIADRLGEQIGGAAAPTLGMVSRGSDLSIDALTLGTAGGSNTIATTGALSVGSAGIDSVRVGGALTLTAGTTATVNGRIINIAPSTAPVTINGVTVDIDDVALAGDLILAPGTGGVSFGALTGTGARNITSAGGITGVSIDGASAVTLTAGTAAPITVTGAIGGTTAVGALTIDGGSTVTIGTVGTTATTLGVTGATDIGATTRPGALVVNGAVVSGGSFTSRTVGVTDLDAVTGTGAFSVTTTGAGGNVGFTTLAGAGAKTIASAAGIAGDLVTSDGDVALTAATSAPVTITQAILAGGAIAINGGSAVSIGTDPAGTALRSGGTLSIGQGLAAGSLAVTGRATAGTAFASTTTGATDVDSVDAGSTLALTSTGGSVVFDALGAPGLTSVGAATSIGGNSVDGGGAVRLIAGTASPVAIGTIGATTPAASLTISGGGTVTLGIAGNTGAAVRVAGATRVGQPGDGAATGSLVVNGALVSGGSVTATTTGAIDLDDVRDLTATPGTLALTTGAGQISFANLRGAGAKTLVSGAGIDGTSIAGGGAVTLVAATTSPVVIGSIGAVGTPVAALTINGGSVVTLGSAGSVATNLVVTGATSIGQAPGAATGALTVNGALTTGTLASTTASAVFNGPVTSTGAASIVAIGGDVVGTTLVSGGSVDIRSAGATTIVGGSSGGTADFAVAADGTATITGAVIAGGGYRVRGRSVSLGGAVTQSANGVVDITATAGTLTGGAGLTLAANADGAGAEALVLDTSGGAIAFGGTTLLGGTATQRSDVGILVRTPATPVTLGVVTARTLGGASVARGPIGTLTNAGDVTIGRADVQRTLAITSTGGTIALGTATVTGAGQGVTLLTNGSGGDITAATLSAPGAVSIDARGAAGVGSATAGSLFVRGTIATLGTGDIGGTLDMISTTGALRLGSAIVGGAATLSSAAALEVTTNLQSGGTATIGAATNAALNRVRVTTGDLLVSAGGTVGGIGTGRADLSATGTGGDVRITAVGAARLGPIAAADSVAVSASAIDASTVAAGTGSLDLTATAGNIALVDGTAAGLATLIATGRIDATRVAAAGIRLTAGAVASGSELIASGIIQATAGGGISYARVRGSDVSITAGGTIALTDTAATGFLTLFSTGADITLGTATAAGAATLRSAGATTANSLSATGAASVVAGGTIDIDTLNGGSVAATGAIVDITDTVAGTTLALTSTAGALSLRNGSAGATATLTSAGALDVTGTLRGTGAVTTTSAGATTIATVASTGAGITARGASVAATNASANQALSLTSTGGAVTLGTGVAGTTATLTAAGPLAVTTSLTAAGNVAATATGAVTLASVTSTAGSLTVSGPSIAATTLRSGTTMSLDATAGALSVGTGTAGAAATLRSTGALTATMLSVQGAAVLTAGTTLTTTTLNATGAATLIATGAAMLGATTSGGAVAITANGITAGRTVAATTLAMTSGGALSLASGQAGGDASFDAQTLASLGAVTAGTAAGITVRALDAAITGTQAAARVTFVNRTPASNIVKLGNATSTGGFALSQDEVNFVNAGALTIDGGTGAVEFGTLAFVGAAGSASVNVLATGRIDVLGAVSGTGTGRTFRLGGTAGNVAAKSSVIQLVTTPTGGGRLLMGNANLDLRGTRIGAGQAAGFLDTIDFDQATGLPADDVAQLFVGNANSSLYNSTFGGTLYAPTGVTYLSANTLTVRYTDYALFQNTGAPGINAGAALGSATAPVNGALVIEGSGSTIPNSFALFGTINGIDGNSTAVLGPTIIGVTAANIASTRVNGCIIGSGAGCLTSVVSQPALNIFDSSRIDVFRSADDLALPFDPVIGTNNEALFSGITSLDVPISSTECAPGTESPECAAPQGERK